MVPHCEFKVIYVPSRLAECYEESEAIHTFSKVVSIACYGVKQMMEWFLSSIGTTSKGLLAGQNQKVRQLKMFLLASWCIVLLLPLFYRLNSQVSSAYIKI